MANTYVAIATVTVGSGGASAITFSSIPSTYKDLTLLISARGSRSSNTDFMQIKFNGSSTSYNARYIGQSGGTSVNSFSSTDIYYPINGSTSTANTFGNTLFYIPNYAGSNIKSVSCDAVYSSNGTAGTDFQMYLVAGTWSSTSAITQIDLSPLSGYGPNILQYSTATLYGIKNS